MKSKNIFALTGLVFLVIFIFLIIYFFKNSKSENYDPREIECNGKEIDSIEFDIDKQECFETKISACQIPSFKSIEKCEELNGINKSENKTTITGDETVTTEDEVKTTENQE